MNEDKKLEETIKYIKNIINATYITATLKDKDGNIIEEGLVNQQVIQDLLDLYNKEKQEKNYLIENSIPKKKIKDIIKELKKKIPEDINCANDYDLDNEINYKIEVLDEILEDK